MKLINILPATMLCAALLNTNYASAQTWNVTGNAGTATTNYLGTSDAKDLKIKTNNQTRMFVKSSGQVGIGTTSPAALLHVQKTTLSEVLIKSTGDGSQLTIDRAGNGWDAVTRYTQTGVPQWKTGLTVNGTGSPDYVIRNEITSTDAVSISGSGNYVTLPAGVLYMGTTNTSSIVTYGSDLRIKAYAPNNNSTDPAGNIVLAYTGSFFKSGNVSIGTNDASKAKFVVQGATGNTIALFRRTSSSAGVSIIGDWPAILFNSYYNAGNFAMSPGYAGMVNFDIVSGKVVIGSSVAAAVAAGDAVSVSEALVVNASGNVGIGTNANTYKLDVCGTMRAKEVRVATGWCDYVFADDYKLPALNDVEAFIKANKHLPDVTPGAIIESEGLEVGKTSAQMIKKIEELTLYVIDLQKQVNELKKNDK